MEPGRPSEARQLLGPAGSRGRYRRFSHSDAPSPARWVKSSGACTRRGVEERPQAGARVSSEGTPDHRRAAVVLPRGGRNRRSRCGRSASGAVSGTNEAIGTELRGLAHPPRWWPRCSRTTRSTLQRTGRGRLRAVGDARGLLGSEGAPLSKSSIRRLRGGMLTAGHADQVIAWQGGRVRRAGRNAKELGALLPEAVSAPDWRRETSSWRCGDC